MEGRRLVLARRAQRKRDSDYSGLIVIETFISGIRRFGQGQAAAPTNFIENLDCQQNLLCRSQNLPY